MPRMQGVAALVAVGLLAATPARADDEDRTDGQRIWHLAPMAAGGIVYLVLEFGLKDAITPDECRWCSTNAFDDRVRDAWKWHDVRAADKWSDVTGYVAGPALAVGLLVATTADRPRIRRWFDDTIPVLQAGIITGMLNQAMKVTAGRTRPYTEYGGESVQPEGDTVTSFFSGHAALAFAMTTASGTVASLRGYRSAPVLWAGGAALAVVTSYLRIASDAHYATDVIAGGLVGAGVGVAVPMLFHRAHLRGRHPGLTVTPSVSTTPGGMSLTLRGTF